MSTAFIIGVSMIVTAVTLVLIAIMIRGVLVNNSCRTIYYLFGPSPHQAGRRKDMTP